MLNPLRRVLAIAVATVAVVGAGAATADAAASGTTVCSATKRVINGGKPAAWASKLFGVVKTKKYASPVPKAFLQRACQKNSNDPGWEYYPGKLDFHRAWKVRDPLDDEGAWYRVMPGKEGIALFVGSMYFYSERCVYESARFPLGFSGVPSTGAPLNFYGLATDDVTAIESSGGTGTRTGPDGSVLPTTVRVTPSHNVFHLFAPNGADRLSFIRKDKPTVVESFYGSAPISGCLRSSPKYGVVGMRR